MGVWEFGHLGIWAFGLVGFGGIVELLKAWRVGVPFPKNLRQKMKTLRIDSKDCTGFEVRGNTFTEVCHITAPDYATF